VGRLEENSRILRDFLQSRPGRQACILSLSKGGADLKWALRDDPSCLDAISLWMNIGGTLSGTPLIEWVQKRAWLDWINRANFFFRGRSYAFFTELLRGSGCPLDFQLELPSRLHAMHVVAVALPRHARTRYARISHRAFAPWGPNDGVLLLEDLLTLPGTLLPIWGTDHYFGPRWDVHALLNCLFSYWEDRIA
jgi:hypothetical protein